MKTDTQLRDDVQAEIHWTPEITAADIGVSAKDGVVTLTGQLERRSDIPVAVGLSSRVDGVVAVVDRLSYQLDDSHLRPAEQAALHGITDDWTRRL